MKKARLQNIQMSVHTSFILSIELANLFDEVLIEGLSWENLNKIIPDNLNIYWQDILKFLEIVSEIYPRYLEEHNLIDIREAQIKKLRDLIDFLSRNRIEKKIIAAGNTATQPIISELLEVIAKLDNGYVILSGLDKISTDEEFNSYEEGHNQYGLKRFINKVGISREDILEWDILEESSVDTEKKRLLVESLKPIEQTGSWRNIEEFSDKVLEGIVKIESKDEREEAVVISLIMREALETEGKTAALITSDISLGQRVGIELERFGININNSAGFLLKDTGVGIYFGLILRFILSPSPITLLSLMTHPLAGCGFGDECRNMAKKFDKFLRGKNNVYTFESIRESLGEEELQISFDKMISQTNQIRMMKEDDSSLEAILKAHIRLGEDWAITSDKLWQGPSGIAMSKLFNELLEDSDSFYEINLKDYEKLFIQFEKQVTVRNSYSSHSRLEILGPMEARLQHKDIMILGGLNEGNFPNTQEAGPWMSYKMRLDFGLPSFKQRLGISSSDFVNIMMAKEVYLTRSLKKQGSPTIASRWLQRLEAVIGIACNKALEKSDFYNNNKWLYLASIIDKPEEEVRLEALSYKLEDNLFPKTLSVSSIELLKKDPYSFYVKYILKIRPLDKLEPKIEARDYGSILHELFSWYVEEVESGNKDIDIELVRRKALLKFKEKGISLFWENMFIRCMEWLIKDILNRESGTKSYTEIRGKTEVLGTEITAIADRIDISEEGKVKVIDYKTGNPPSEKEVIKGYAPQLLIEGLIIRDGGFKEFSQKEVEDLYYYKIGGKTDKFEKKQIKPKDANIEELLENTEEGISRLIKHYSRKGVDYEARPDPLIEFRFSSYEHLERIKEWGLESGGEKKR